MSNDTLILDSHKNSAFLDLRELTVLFKSGWMLLDQIKPATNDSVSSSLGSASVPYGYFYFAKGLYAENGPVRIIKDNGNGADTAVVLYDKSGTILARWDTIGTMANTGNLSAPSIIGTGGYSAALRGDGVSGYQRNLQGMYMLIDNIIYNPRGNASYSGRTYLLNTASVDTTTDKGGIAWLDSLAWNVKFANL
jgi:hypothetical protein